MTPLQASLIQQMFPNADLRNVGRGQIRWSDDTHDCSITIFAPEDVGHMKRASFAMNDVVWIDRVRFSRTPRV